jgi:hypothetical protein
MVSFQTLHFRGSPSFFFLSSVLHCQRNGKSSAFRESSLEMLGLDPALPTQQVGLPAGPVAEVCGNVCLPNPHSPHRWGLQRMGRPGHVKQQHIFTLSSLTLNPLLYAVLC